MSIAGVTTQSTQAAQGAATQAVANQAASAMSSAASSSTGTAAGATTITGLSANLNTFLKMLMTQLQHQDPTQPLDTAQFTNQLVEYSSVEQQIQTNSNLTQLIQLNQGNEVVQSAAIVGKKADVTSSQLALQNSTATVQFTAPSAGPASVVITDSSGHQLAATTVQATAGSNSFTWDGQNYAGTTEPDGVYNVAVTQAGANGASTTLPTNVVGTVTGVQANGTAVTLQLGALSVDFSKLQSIEP